MVPTVQPPPPVRNFDETSSSAPSLEDTIYKLYNLIHGITLPKTKTAKSAAITVEALHAARDLTAAARGALSVHQESPLLGKVSQQLDAITAHLAIPNVPSSERKLSYAAALTSNTHSAPTPASTPRVISTANSSVHPHFRPRPLPAKRFDITLSQKT